MSLFGQGCGNCGNLVDVRCVLGKEAVERPFVLLGQSRGRWRLDGAVQEMEVNFGGLGQLVDDGS